MKMYDSLKEVVQESLQRNKANPTAPGGTKENNAPMLNDAVEELEKFVAYRTGRLKAAVRESTALLASEAQHAEQVIDGLKTNIATLESRLRQSEDTSRGKEVARQKSEEQLTAKIEALEAKLRETEKIVRDKAAIIQGLEQNANTKIQDLENQLRNKEKLLTSRSREVIDLKAQLDRLKNGIKEMSSFFKQAEVLGAVDGQDNSTVSPKGEVKTADAKPASSQVKGNPGAITPPGADEENLSPEFFKQLTLELTQTIGPMAPLIVRDHVKSLGETMEQFPKARVRELLETVSSEILDEKVKTGFRERIAQINGHV
jgi:chromosome segregation ATPase